MYEEMMALLIIACIIVWTAVLIKYLHENKKYKNSSYGKQSSKSFWKTILNQGARGEYRTSLVIDDAPLKNKMIFNCYIANRSGDKTEIDMIMLCNKGIYVIENKNYSGWIFGDEKSKNWCETLKGKKYFFYNPIKQNKSHIKNLEKMLKIGDEKYISLITFNANANLKKVSAESQNVYVIGYNKLKQFMKDQLDKSDALTDEQIEEIYQKLLPGTQLSDAEKQEHIERIRKTYKK